MDIFKKLFGKGSSETLPYKPEAKVLSTEWAQELSLTLAPGVTMELVRIPAGEFLMGSDTNKDKAADYEETPQHRLHLEEYLIGKTPVTNAQYLAFVQATGHKPPEFWIQGVIPQGKEQHPVVNISWFDAFAFCRWAGQGSGHVVHLPSEAEWEKAARAAGGRIWPWGSHPPDKKRCNFNNNVGGTTPVGQYSPRGDSPYGCADMAGNIDEWTSSLKKRYPYNAKDGREDLSGQPWHIQQVLRGGSYNSSGSYVRCAFRHRCDHFLRPDDCGFRVGVFPF